MTPFLFQSVSDMRRVFFLCRFVEAVITDVVIEGRNLEDVHHWVSEGAMPWLWEQPAGFKTRDDHAVVVTRITFHAVDRETGQRAGAR